MFEINIKFSKLAYGRKQKKIALSVDRYLEEQKRIEENHRKFMEIVTKKPKDIIELEKIWNA